MSVPFIDLRRFEPDFLERWADKCAEVSRNTMFVGGPEASKLEQTLSARTGANSVVACANGTDALQLALRACDVGRDDVVLIPDATFWATFEAVVNVNAHPVTVDINPTDLQMDFELFKEACEKYKPKAAILVHLYGWASKDLKKFRSYCKDKGIVLIEDGAQAFDVDVDGESIYKGAHISTISFYVAKVLGACGDAGAVFCSSEELATKVRQLGNHGRTTHYGHGLVGWNSRIGGLDAAYLNLSLEYIDARIESRRKVAERYRELYKKLDVCYVSPPEGIKENAYLTVSLFDPAERPKIEEPLKENGIGFGNVYPGAMSEQPGAEKFIHGKVGGDIADKVCRGVLNLPLFTYMKEDEIDTVEKVFQKALEGARSN